MTGVGFKKANKVKDRAEGNHNPSTRINARTGLDYTDLAMIQIEMMEWTWQEVTDLLERRVKYFTFTDV